MILADKCAAYVLSSPALSLLFKNHASQDFKPLHCHISNTRQMWNNEILKAVSTFEFAFIHTLYVDSNVFLRKNRSLVDSRCRWWGWYRLRTVAALCHRGPKLTVEGRSEKWQHMTMLNDLNNGDKLRQLTSRPASITGYCGSSMAPLERTNEFTHKQSMYTFMYPPFLPLQS